MNQAVLLEILQKEFRKGNKEFMTIKEIERLIFEDPVYKCVLNIKQVRLLIRKLYAFGFLEIQNPKPQKNGRVEASWKKAYRVKATVLDMKFISPLDKDITIKEQKALSNG